MSEQAEVKEPYLHCPDITAPWRISISADYADLFAGAPSGSRFLGEASAAFLYAGCAVPDILSMWPQARFVVMLRSSLELVASLHKLHWESGMEVPELAEVWWLKEARAHGEALPRGFVHGRLHPYGRTAALRDALAFIGVDDGGRTSFAPSLSHRSQRLQCGIGTLGRLVSRPAAAVRLTDALRRVNTRQARRAVDAVLTVELHAHFRDDVGLLSEAMKRDLSPWMEGLSAREPGSAI